jgi:hypothetical protein
MANDDLVERLHGHSRTMERDKGKFVRFIDVATCTEAADRITMLEAENAKLRADNAALVEGAEARGYARGIREAAEATRDVPSPFVGAGGWDKQDEGFCRAKTAIQSTILAKLGATDAE